MKKIYITLLFLLAFPVLGLAQFSFTFLPEVHGRTLEGLMMVKIMNGESQRRSCFLVITVTEAVSGKIASAKASAFDLQPGMNSLPSNIVYTAAWQFSNNKLATVLKQSHYFPEGEYEYCFELYDNDKNAPGALLAEQCFNYQLEPFSPLMLSEPYDGDLICEKRPTFFWQPIVPAIPGMQYRLVLVEVKEGQARAEALQYNMPIIQQTNIPTPMLFYPPLSKELEEGKRYAWQVLANRGDMILGRSEIWDFVVQCDEKKTVLPSESFRNIEDLARGNFYIAEGQIFFAVNNTYAKAPLQYSIQCLTKPETKLKKLPKVNLEHGRNEIIIDLRDEKAFVDGYFYILTMRLPNGETRQLRFIYKEETDQP